MIQELNKNRIKWIDILNIIAKGETPPKKIKYNLNIPEYQTLIYDEDAQEYRYENDYDNFEHIPNHHLNDTVEILAVDEDFNIGYESIFIIGSSD